MEIFGEILLFVNIVLLTDHECPGFVPQAPLTERINWPKELLKIDQKEKIFNFQTNQNPDKV